MSQALEMAWREKREVIRRRFAKEANRLNDEEEGDRWKVELVKGNPALRLHNDEVYGLLFSKDESARKVICEATVSRSDSSGVDAIEGIRESFDLDNLTESEVDRKINEFVARLVPD